MVAAVKYTTNNKQTKTLDLKKKEKPKNTGKEITVCQERN